MSDITDALESLIASEGWRLIAGTARTEWATRERQGRKTALNDTDDKRALDKLRQITAAQEAVEWVLELPKQEIARLKRMEQDTELQQQSRRATVAIDAASMSRRGNL